MKSTEGMTLRLTHLACNRAYKSGFKAEDIQDAFEHPTEITPNQEFPGQFTIANPKMRIVGVPDGNKFVGITLGKNSAKR